MLSAVAARKARLAQSQTQAAAETEAPPTASVSPRRATKRLAPPKPSAPIQKLPSKRKPSAFAGNTPKRKKTQAQRTAALPSLRARYYAEDDAFRAQNDDIAGDDNDSQDSAPPSSAVSDADDAVSTMHVPGADRAWTPSAPLADSSDEEDGDDGDEPIVLEQSLPTSGKPTLDAPRVLSTFQPVRDKNVFYLPNTDDSLPKRTVLLLDRLDTVTILGSYTLTILRGSVVLAGVTLTTSTTAHPVFAPRSSPLPTIHCLPPKAPASGFPSLPNLPENIADAASYADAVVILQELQTGIEGLGRVCRPFNGFFTPSRWHQSQVRFDMGLDNVYFMPAQTLDTYPLIVPKTWTAVTEAALSCKDDDGASQEPVYLVKGPKNAGKSTFARLLLNKLLSRYRHVAYLECDIGQSEFTPGGMVSLNVVEQPIFGPPFSHPSIPLAAHFVGATSPRTSPSHYLDSIQALMQHYALDVQNATLDEDNVDNKDTRINSIIPLVINTMGWTKGLGANLAQKVEEIVEPSDIFAFKLSAAEEGLLHATSTPGPPILHPCRIHTMEAIPLGDASSRYTAADHRNLCLLSYFHAVFPQKAALSPYASPTPLTWNIALPLCAQQPYEVDWPVAIDKLILTGAGFEDVIPAEVHRALNCAVVALVSCDPGTLNIQAPLDEETNGSARTPFHYEQGAFLPLPSASRCVGLGLVRAVSCSSSKPSIQLLTPVPPYLLSSARVLVMGEMQLPVWGMLDFRTLDDGGDVAGYERSRVPFLRWGKGEGAGGERRRVRRNLMRKGQM
ncbi:hypothetical protein BC628DRAFT_1359721 [Trametes gibbosa]|nr:hypothetical protein BC628DRAFT_1359721 [Trametes gibbosa]